MIAFLRALLRMDEPPPRQRTVAVYSPSRRCVVIITNGGWLEVPDDEVLDLAESLYAAFAVRGRAEQLIASRLQ